MMREPVILSALERLVLSAVSRLVDNAYGVTIHQIVSVDFDVSYGSLYLTLERLENMGLVSSYSGLGGVSRGGSAKRCFVIMPAGRSLL